MATNRFACVLAALLLCSAAPSLAEDSPNFARRLTQLGFLQGFANFAGTAPVTDDTVANTNNPAIDPLQPGCTDYVLIFNACSACAQGYQYNANAADRVCGCAPGYSRDDDDSACVFSGTGPAPAPVPSPTTAPPPGLPGNYGGPIPDPVTNPSAFVAFQAAITSNVNSILSALGIQAAGR